MNHALLQLHPFTISQARSFVAQHHRHHHPPPGGLFALAVAINDQIVGCAIVGRPIARAYQDGHTAEVTRLCTIDGQTHAASKLYAAAWRAARAIGYTRLITYTLASERGTSVHAAGWRELHKTKGGSWNCPSRPRSDTHPTAPKTLWEAP